MENISAEAIPVLFSFSGRLLCFSSAVILTRNRPMTRWAGRCIVRSALLAVLHASLFGGQFHVTADASSSGTGTLAKPWQLQVAVHHQAAVKPGDTIWVHGGVYNGQYTCALNGTPSLPVVVRNY